MAEFILDVRVYIEDTDTGGMVYYINYLKYMERARTEYLRSMGFEISDLLAAEYFLVVRSADIKFRAAARLDDELTVSAKIIGQRPASILFDQKVVRIRDNRLICEADIGIACIHSKTGKPAAMPQELLHEFAQKGSDV